MGETAGSEIGHGGIVPSAEIHESHEFPVSLEVRTDRIFSSFNVAPRAIMLLLAGETPIDQESFYSSYVALFEGSDLEDIGSSAIRHYSSSLAGAGLLKITEDGIVLTPEGKKYGQPLAAMFVDFEKNQGHCLYPVFLPRGSRGTSKSYLNRARILQQLSDKGKTEVDLAWELNLPATTIGGGLRELRNAGAVDYFSPSSQIERERQRVTDRVVGEPPDSRIKIPRNVPRKIYGEIIRVCLALHQDHCPITREGIFSVMSEETKRNWQPRSLNHTIAGVLPFLRSQGFLERITSPEAKLTTKGRLIVDMIIDPLQDAVGDGLTLEHLRTTLLPKVLGDLSGYARTTADFYYPHSQGFMIRQSGGGQERMKKIISILPPPAEKGFTAADIAERLGEKRNTVNSDLRFLVRTSKGKVIKKKSPQNIYYYNLVPTE